MSTRRLRTATGSPPELLPHMGEDAAHGIRWYLSRPPIIGLDFEMDLRGYRRKFWL